MSKKVNLKIMLLILGVCGLSIALSVTMLLTVLQAYHNGGTITIAVNQVLGNSEFFADIVLFSLTLILSAILIIIVFRSTGTIHEIVKDASENETKIMRSNTKVLSDAEF